MDWLIKIGLAVALYLLYLHNAKKRNESGEVERPLSKQEKRLHSQIMAGTLIIGVTLILGAFPGVVAILYLVDARNPQTIADWSAVLLAIFLGCFIGFGLIRDARRKLRAIAARHRDSLNAPV